MWTRWILVPIVLAMVINLSACSKCRQLADQLCECEESVTAKNQCRVNNDMYGQHPSFDKAADEAHCAAVMNNPACNCAAIKLHDNEFENCGMTRDDYP